MGTRGNPTFLATLWAALILAWIFSGEQFLDLMFAMPDAGAVDDWLLGIVVRAEDMRAAWGAPDLFASWRGLLHRTFGLG
ncbi:hypothetical protein [Wenxinia saemankumensis]|uniref:Uncharacterized protein n=1 Tax=Wenxinia saemankumensis TaxID=1447782 RepID=A0A1M6A9R6_9RHOB|nr:hypothetical protein [Wenxinia saemankumensis]SHI33201.1 hypothetical protein SAMN05444417_0313 [Wenxinia saemankumensis]